MHLRSHFPILFTAWGLALFLVGCSLPRQAALTPTQDATQALITVQALLTHPVGEGGGASFTPAPAASQTPVPTQSPAVAVLSPTPPSNNPSSTSVLNDTDALPTPSITLTVCNRAAAGSPIDVTIPDDTEMEAGETFTKIWKLQNIGSCTWTTGYMASYFYGERMGGPDTVPLEDVVPPGSSVEIIVEMVAPASPGTYQSNWKLRNPEGEWFGIGPNGDAPFWVRIVVVEPDPPTPTATFLPSATPTPTPSETPTPTPTATPAIQASGTLVLAPGDLLELDTAQVNPGADEDLAYQVDVLNFHYLIPQQGALLGVFGSSQPGREACLSANMSTAPIPVESLALQTYLCYRTSQGLPGWALLTDLNQEAFTLTLEIRTWVLP